jgi:hypothetical protein
LRTSSGSEHRGRLVHDDEAGVAGQGRGHAHHLLPGRGQPAQLAAHGDLRVAQARQQVAGDPLGVAGPGEAQPRRLAPEHHVLGHRQAGHEVELLVDHRDPGDVGGVRGGEGDRAAVPEDLTGVGAVRPAQHLDQRGLAGPVLAE